MGRCSVSARAVCAVTKSASAARRTAPFDVHCLTVTKYHVGFVAGQNPATWLPRGRQSPSEAIAWSRFPLIFHWRMPDHRVVFRRPLGSPVRPMSPPVEE
jgi:hypothetical protein